MCRAWSLLFALLVLVLLLLLFSTVLFDSEEGEAGEAFGDNGSMLLLLPGAVAEVRLVAVERFSYKSIREDRMQIKSKQEDWM